MSKTTTTRTTTSTSVTVKPLRLDVAERAVVWAGMKLFGKRGG
jgi:hypothetical protein